MTKPLIFAEAAVDIMAAPVPVFGDQGFARSVVKTVTIVGAVVEFRFVNPQSLISLDVDYASR